MTRLGRGAILDRRATLRTKGIAIVHHLRDAIHSARIVLIFFYRGSDDYSYKLRRRLRVVTKRYPLASGFAIDVDTYPAASGEFGIFKIPTVRIYVDGSMALQKAGGFALDEVEDILDHYSQRMGGAE